MTARLEQLLAAATPGPWVVQKEAPWIAGHISYDDACLTVLAPDMARLLIDMGDALLWTDNSLSHVLSGRPHRAITEVHAANATLLARLDALGKDTA